MLLSLLRSNAGQPARARSTQNAHEHGFSLIVLCMRRCNQVGFAFLNQGGKPLVTQIPCCCFQADFLGTRMGRSIAGTKVKSKLELRRHGAHKFLVSIGFRAANLVMKVCHREHNAQFAPQIQQNAHKGHRVRATRAGNGHAISCLEQPLLANIFQHPFH